ncbi:flagellar protein FlgN [Yoonia vestfoldensis]|uniref:flagellar protein FlgN n=1 Tax=Yoonia vestfoldensis TaxID=245188 RepID=UPI001FDEE6CE|nr:flagellar protein FlgN [Yoonia vestfoldensis]
MADLVALLETETAAIIAGEYAVLDDLAGRKQDLLTHLQHIPTATGDLQTIGRLLARNQSLLAAAIKGISAARVRLAALQAVRDGLQVYDQSGQFAVAPVSRPELVKKA